MEPIGRVFLSSEAQYLDRGNGVRSLPLASRESGAEQTLTGITEIPVGGEIPLHTHSSEEFIYVLSGEAIVRIEDREERVAVADSTLLPPGTVHQFVNVSSEVLVILWVYGDPDTTRTLVSTGKVLGHLDRYDDASPR